MTKQNRSTATTQEPRVREVAPMEAAITLVQDLMSLVVRLNDNSVGRLAFEDIHRHPTMQNAKELLDAVIPVVPYKTKHARRKQVGAFTIFTTWDEAISKAKETRSTIKAVILEAPRAITCRVWPNGGVSNVEPAEADLWTAMDRTSRNTGTTTFPYGSTR